MGEVQKLNGTNPLYAIVTTAEHLKNSATGEDTNIILLKIAEVINQMEDNACIAHLTLGL